MEVYVDLNPDVEVELIPEEGIDVDQVLLPLGARCLNDASCESTACRSLARATEQVELWVNLPNVVPGGVAKLPVYTAQGAELRLSVQFVRADRQWSWIASVEGAEMIDPLVPVAACEGNIPVTSSGRLQLPEPVTCTITLSDREQNFRLSFGDQKAGSTGNAGSFEVLHADQDGYPGQMRCIAL